MEVLIMAKLNNKQIADTYKTRYEHWKRESLDNSGFFVIFNGFSDEISAIDHKTLLQKISGGALKLFIFIGLKSNNYTGESYYSIKSLFKYFNVSERTINNWFRELEKLNLIYRTQLEYGGVSHTYLQIYKTPDRTHD